MWPAHTAQPGIYFYVIEDIEEFFILFYLWEQEETVTEGNAVIIVHSNTVFDTCL